nr:MAG TPA: hypothetical protein [Caudoviricetes sp.]
MRDRLQQGRQIPPERACKKLRLLPERTRGHARHQEGSSQKAKSRTEEEKIRPRPAAGRLRDLLQPTLPDAQQLPRRLELHRMPLLPGTQICPPVEAGDHHNLKGVSNGNADRKSQRGTKVATVLIEILNLAAALEWIALGVLVFFKLRSLKRQAEVVLETLDAAAWKSIKQEEKVWRKNTLNEIRAAFGFPPITPTEYTEMKIREETAR